eukprot:7958532-Ditylum_brightwellii.AAC.1
MLLSAIDESADNALDSFGSNMLWMLLLALFVEDHQVPYFEGHFCSSFQWREDWVISTVEASRQKLL